VGCLPLEWKVFVSCFGSAIDARCGQIRAEESMSACYRQCWLPVALIALGPVTATARANPVTGWLKDTSFGGGPTAVLSAADTNAPVLGNGASNNADNVAIYAQFPLVSLSNGERITLSGSAQTIGTSSTGDFRWGLFKDDGVGAAAAGWLGYIASAESILWSKDPSGTNFSTTTFASVAAGRGAELGATAEPNGLPFAPGTYDFRMTVDRFGNEVDIQIAIESAASGFSIESPVYTESVPARLTTAFDRVGLLAGGALDADQVRFSGIDVSTSLLDVPRLRVDDAGRIFITNTTGHDLEFYQYEITSSSGALSHSGWLSLDDQENNDPVGMGWEESGGSGPKVLAEVNLQSIATLPSGESYRLGSGFNPAAAKDLAFRYTSPTGELVRGVVEYVKAGDYNASGIVDAADYVVWRKMLGQNVAYGSGADGDGNGLVDPADYGVWRGNFGNGTTVGSAVAAPEPATNTALLMAIVIAVAPLARQARKSHYTASTTRKGYKKRNG
jgi:hypothetical protein